LSFFVKVNPLLLDEELEHILDLESTLSWLCPEMDIASGF